MNRWFSSAGSLLQSAAEYVAPPVRTPLEELRQHWHALKVFYADELQDIEGEGIPDHVNSICRVLLEEEPGQKSRMGPCLEFFFNNRIMEILAALAEKDSPQGMRSLVLPAIVSLLRNLRVDILPHMSVHQPLQRLLAAYVEGRVPALSAAHRPDFVGLQCAVAERLVADPAALPFFTDAGGQLALLRGLVGAWAAGTRTGGSAQPTFSSGGAGEAEHPPLAPADAARVRTALAALLAVPGVPAADPLLTKQFAPQLATRIAGRFITLFTSAAHAMDAPARAAAASELRAEVRLLAACVNVGPAELQEALLAALDEHLLTAVVTPGLQHPEHAAGALDQLRALLADAKASRLLLRALLYFLLGDEGAPETPAGPPPPAPLMHTAVLARLSLTTPPAVRLAALRLLDELLATGDQFALRQLVLRNFGCSGEWTADSAYRSSDVPQVRAWLLRLLPEADAEPPSYATYVAEARQLVALYAAHARRWQDDAPPRSVIAARACGFFPGELLARCLALLENMTQLSFSENLALTAVLTCLCRYPDEGLHWFLFSAVPPAPYTSNLFGALKKLAAAARALHSRVPNFRGTLVRVRDRLNTTAAAEPDASADERALEALVVLEEFAAELAAHLDASPLLFAATSAPQRPAAAASS